MRDCNGCMDFPSGCCACVRKGDVAIDQVRVRFDLLPLAVAALNPGDRVVIREGYNSAGSVGYFEGRSNDEAGKVIVHFGEGAEGLEGVANSLLAAAIAPMPYTKRQRAERAAEAWRADLHKDVADRLSTADQAALVDLLERGV